MLTVSYFMMHICFRKDVRLPVQLQRAMAAEAEAAREARAKVKITHFHHDPKDSSLQNHHCRLLQQRESKRHQGNFTFAFVTMLKFSFQGTERCSSSHQ